MKDSLRIAHLSDLHFAHITWSPSQFLSKRWLGNWNLILFRNRNYQTDHLAHLPELFQKFNIDFTIITGDVSSTSLDQEFLKAKNFIDKFSSPSFVVPGNHDCYTKEAMGKKTFYNYFGSESLKNIRIEKSVLKNKWWWVGLDCALATPPFFSKGRFFKEMEEPLKQVLRSIPSGDNVVVGNHFPLFTTHRPEHDLACAERLQDILKSFPQVKLYLHGHDHKPYIIDKRDKGFPLVLNSGSCAHQPNGMFYVIELFENECLVEQFFYREEDETTTWVVNFQKNYSF